MTAAKAWEKSQPQDNETVAKVINSCVLALKTRGIKTTAAIYDLANALGTTQRRIQSFVYRDREPVILKDEWNSLRLKAGLFLLSEAQRLRDLAERFEADGDRLVSDNDEIYRGNNSLWSEDYSKNVSVRHLK